MEYLLAGTAKSLIEYINQKVNLFSVLCSSLLSDNHIFFNYKNIPKRIVITIFSNDFRCDTQNVIYFSIMYLIVHHIGFIS